MASAALSRKVHGRDRLRRRSSATVLACCILVSVTWTFRMLGSTSNSQTALLGTTAATPPLSLSSIDALLEAAAKKDSHVEIIPTNQSPSGGAFVHMGKTGGSSLSVLLRNGCHSYMPHPCRNITTTTTNIDTGESTASKLIESYYHVPDFGLLRQSHHDFYLITLRDPFDRTISSFCFEHILNRDARQEPVAMRPKMEAAYSCFSTLERFVSYLEPRHSMDNPSIDFVYPYHRAMVVDSSCVDLARAALAGRVKLYSHFYFNYARLILELIPNIQTQTIYINRQEHLWEDWMTINGILQGGSVDLTTAASKNNNHLQEQGDAGAGVVIRNMTHLELNNQLPLTRKLSDKGRATLCRALQPEYNAYFWLLQHANNLSPLDVKRSIRDATFKCPMISVPFIP